ncbi:MAG: hypothetical protein Q7T25_14080 [Sideroxyarcus sp.]|nr:hypothetical protein [Sideroxyarcus sp.]
MNAVANTQAIIARCAALGLSFTQVQRLAGPDHSLRDLAEVLGLDGVSFAPLNPRNWLSMAAQTCSVSYRVVLTPERLLEALTTGTVAPSDVATFLHFLEEAPLLIVVMAVEQAAQESGVTIGQIWRYLDQIAATWSATRLRSVAGTV